MLLNKNTSNNYSIRQLKLPLEIEKIIDISDPVYTFCEVVEHIDLTPYFIDDKGYKTGRPKCDAQKLLKVILFAFMEYGIRSLRDIEKLCRNDIRFMYLLDGMKVPSFATFRNFIRNELTAPIEQIFREINHYIFEVDRVDLEHAYIDGTKIEANANRYTWVWKKSCLRNRDKVFEKISVLIDEINTQVLSYQGIMFEKREIYAIDYVEGLLKQYQMVTNLDVTCFVSGKGHHKTIFQRQYQELPGYNVQTVICDEYISVIDAQAYAADQDCFVPLMEKFKEMYGHYPKYPVADAGYGSYNNYLYCEEKGMEKYIKFTMFEKETKNEKYHKNPYRAVNFKQDTAGNLLCPNNRKFIFKYNKHVKGNRYGRTEEVYECENCEGCPYRAECCRSTTRNRTVRINKELTAFHEEVIANLETIHGALLLMNRSIQAEGTFGIIKWDRSYKRLFRRGKENVLLELTLISCGYNLYKYHNKKKRANSIVA